MSYIRFFIFCWVLCGGLAEFGHAQTVKLYRPTVIWSVSQANYFFKDQSFALMELHTNSSTDASFNTFSDKFPANQLARLQWLIGYERKFGERWSGGLNYRMAYQKAFDIRYYRVYASHRGKLGKHWQLSKTGTVERRVPVNDAAAAAWRFRLWVGLSRRWQVHPKHRLNTVLSYEAFRINSDDELPDEKKRRISRTRLRFALEYPFSDKITLSLFALRQTDYSVALVTSNPPPPTALTQNLNMITPVYGISLRWRINPPENAAKDEQNVREVEI